MTSPAFDQDVPAPLVELLDSQFSRAELARRLGAGVLDIDDSHLKIGLHGPLREFLSRPSKEFRARLVACSWQIAGGTGAVPQRLASLVELLHAGSLIVDDIEDASLERRGRPALHLVHGLPVALNAGNWLYFLAFDLIEQLGLGPHVELGLYRWLSRTLARCHEGQALDLTARMGQLAQREVSALVDTCTRLKTGALMGLSAVVPAVAAGAPARVVGALHDFGEQLGVGLQMLDDLGGLVNEARCHKGHEDLMHGRPTWPWAWLASQLGVTDYARLQRLARQVESRDLHPELLAKEMRVHLGAGSSRFAEAHLAAAHERLLEDLPNPHGLQDLARELRRLLGSYV
ncbi:MAG TPA: polyprenyl synthetase family protein [Polyangiaceae bacterium]